MVDGFLALGNSFFLSPNTVYKSGSSPVCFSDARHS
jgi:hypothetical protein